MWNAKGGRGMLGGTLAWFSEADGRGMSCELMNEICNQMHVGEFL